MLCKRTQIKKNTNQIETQTKTTNLITKIYENVRW